MNRTKSRPGTRMLITGVAFLAVGILLVIGGFATTHVSLAPGTFRTVETPGAPTPFSWLVLVAGIVLSTVGFAKRR